MPSAVPADVEARLPQARMIDPRGHRFGAGVSAIALDGAFLLNAPWLVALALLDRRQRRLWAPLVDLRRGVAKHCPRTLPCTHDPEHEYPPRFAQTLGSVVLIASLVSFLLGAATAGWFLAFAVAGLQTLLAVTGYCLGCRLYFLRWWVPDVLTRIWTPGRSRTATTSFVAEPIRYR